MDIDINNEKKKEFYGENRFLKFTVHKLGKFYHYIKNADVSRESVHFNSLS